MQTSCAYRNVSRRGKKPRTLTRRTHTYLRCLGGGREEARWTTCGKKRKKWRMGQRCTEHGAGSGLFCRNTHTKHCQHINCWKNIKWGDNVMLHFVEVQFREVVDLGRVAERGAECDSLWDNPQDMIVKALIWMMSSQFKHIFFFFFYFFNFVHEHPCSFVLIAAIFLRFILSCVPLRQCRGRLSRGRVNLVPRSLNEPKKASICSFSLP